MTRHFTRLVIAAAVVGVALTAVVATSPAGAAQGNRRVAAGIISTFAGGSAGPGWRRPYRSDWPAAWPLPRAASMSPMGRCGR
jgi:hypothetical protein